MLKSIKKILPLLVQMIPERPKMAQLHNWKSDGYNLSFYQKGMRVKQSRYMIDFDAFPKTYFSSVPQTCTSLAPEVRLFRIAC